jgi:hypothetical protein
MEAALVAEKGGGAEGPGGGEGEGASSCLLSVSIFNHTVSSTFLYSSAIGVWPSFYHLLLLGDSTNLSALPIVPWCFNSGYMLGRPPLPLLFVHFHRSLDSFFIHSRRRSKIRRKDKFFK